MMDAVRRFVQVATVANAVAQAKNCSRREALEWLAEEVTVGRLAPTLYIPARTAGEARYRASSDESIKAWSDMTRRATERRLEPDPMPTATSTWFMHIDCLAKLLSSTEFIGDPAPLHALVHRHSLPQEKSASSAPAPLESDPLHLFAAAESARQRGAATPGPSHTGRVPAFTAQENAILQALVDRGFDPQNMPKAPVCNTPWPLREDIKVTLGYSPEVMRKAWRRLRASGRIADA